MKAAAAKPAPMVKTVAEVEALVAACRYPPAGRRGFDALKATRDALERR